MIFVITAGGKLGELRVKLVRDVKGQGKKRRLEVFTGAWALPQDSPSLNTTPPQVGINPATTLPGYVFTL
ncbi:MAG: hypothetical protein J7L19_02465 [Dehalococcoidia bacterium]|nr:hypothetical protein [Dehalococcoidia bacterium]